MKQELQLGKYKFYPYEFEKETTDNLLEEFKKMLKDCKKKDKNSHNKSAKPKRKARWENPSINRRAEKNGTNYFGIDFNITSGAR